MYIHQHHVDKMIEYLQGKKIFSLFDLTHDYHEIELEEYCKEYAAFNTGRLGFIEYNRLLFGLSNSSWTFQRIMEHVLRYLLLKVI